MSSFFDKDNKLNIAIISVVSVAVVIGIIVAISKRSHVSRIKSK